MTTPAPGPGDERGTEEPTRPVTLVGWAVGGLVAGPAGPPGLRAGRRHRPVVTWAQPLGLLLVAAIIGGTAWSTWRTVQVRRERLEPHRAVNRLVLARACAVSPARWWAAGYLGYALSWLGDASPLADDRLWRSALAALGGAADRASHRCCSSVRVASDRTRPRQLACGA